MDKPKEKPKLTRQQQKALHLFFTLLAEELNNSGLYMNQMLKVDIDWTPHAVKEYLWRPFQKKLYGSESTTELTKLEQIDKIHEVLMRELGEKKEVEYIPFPTQEQVKDSKIYINDSNIR